MAATAEIRRIAPFAFPEIPLPGVNRDDLQAELRAIGQEIERYQGQDEIANGIRLWYERFSRAVPIAADVPGTTRTYIELLQRILICPITGSPLDQRARLGNDGHTYSHQGLSLFLLLADARQRQHSPLHPDLAGAFFTDRHQLVEYMVQWLEDKNALLQNQNLNALFQQLIEEHGQPVIPTRLGIALQARRARALEREQRPEAWRQALEQEDRDLEGAAVRIFNRIDERILQTIARFDARFAHLEDLDAALLEQMRDRINTCQENLDALRTQGETLQGNVDRNNRSIDGIDEGAKTLEGQINEVKQAIEERNMKWWEITIAVAIVVVIAAVTISSGGTGTPSVVILTF